MTTETAPLDPQALRFNREQLRISQRELGKRVAARMGRAEATRAFQVRLHRLEQGDAMSEEDRELLEALATELAVGVDDLATPPVWVWIKLDETRAGIVELGMRMPCWTSPEKAYAARDWLAHASNGHFIPFADAHLVPIRFRALAHDTLDANYPDLKDSERLLLVAVDPDSDSGLPYFAGLNGVLDDERDKLAFDNIVETINMFGLFGEIAQLHELALRRLKLAPPEYPGLVESWRRREERLFEIVETSLAARRAEREQLLEGVPSG